MTQTLWIEAGIIAALLLLVIAIIVLELILRRSKKEDAPLVVARNIMKGHQYEFQVDGKPYVLIMREGRMKPRVNWDEELKKIMEGRR